MKVIESLKENSVILIHIVVWGVLFGIPLLYGFENDAAMRFARRNSVMLIGLMITFYGNFLWGIEKLLFKRKYWRFILFNIALFIFAMVFRNCANTFFDALDDIPTGEGRKHDGLISLFVFNDFIFTLLAISASFGIKYISGLYEIEIERKKLENETLTSELSLLRYQIQPHFFFNCLNNIYALIGSSPTEAQRAVHNLSKMMRFVLYDSSNIAIPLAKEIDFLRNYISLMKLRLSPKASVVTSFPDDVAGVTVPSLLFIPLIENAFKHGVEPGGMADISCEMKVSDTEVSFCVKNKIAESDKAEDRSHSGIGLTNLRKRLDIIYGKKHTFSAQTLENDGVYVSRIVIPIGSVEDNLTV